jgi:hypothetical protein
MNIPSIRIHNSRLLFQSISEDERTKWAERTGQPLTSLEDASVYARQLRDVWMKHQDIIMPAMLDLYDIEFNRNIIDVYVSPWNSSISDPLILNPSRPPEVQVDTLMHELLHVLFTDNTAYCLYDEPREKQLLDYWRDMFGNDLEFKTLVHIPVHAGLKALFLDTLGEPMRLERDILRLQKNPAYKAAWEYVESHDYKQINTDLKALYRTFKEIDS